MEMAAGSEIALDRTIGRQKFPLGFRRQSLAGPIGIGVGLEKADVADRFRRIQGAHPGQGHDPPFVICLLPVKRRFPAIGLNGGPAVRQPPLRPPVTTVVNEFQEFAVGHRPRRDAEPVQPHLVARAFVVEDEAGAVKAGLDKPFGKLDPLDRRRFLDPVISPWRLQGPIGGGQGVARKHVLDVGQH